MDSTIKDPIQYCIRNQLWAELPELLSKLHPADSCRNCCPNCIRPISPTSLSTPLMTISL